MLSPEDQERVVAMLQRNAEPEPESEIQEEVEPTEAEEAILDEDEGEETLEVEAEDEFEDEDGHPVPYNRFRQVNERRKNLQSEIESRDRHLEELQAQLNQKYQQVEQPYRHEYEEEIDEEVDPDSWSARFGRMEEMNQDMQVKLAHIDLQREIAQTKEDFPSVPEAYIWESIAQNGQLSALDAAQQYSSFVAEVEEAAIARYLEEERGSGETPNVPPRPSSQQTTGTEHLAEPLAPQNMDEAREAMVRYLTT